MEWLPFATFEMESANTAAEIVERLQPHVDQPRFVGGSHSTAEFTGFVDTDGFLLRPLIGAQASFVPEIHGRIRPLEKGVAISVEIIPGSAVLTIIAILAGFLGLLIFYTDGRVQFLCAGDVVLCWLLGMAGFWLDRDKGRQKLIAALSEPIRRG
ncbi:MAG: hypothetical protein ACKV0T_25195 [Planctomycetales bacterium]